MYTYICILYIYMHIYAPYIYSKKDQLRHTHLEAQNSPLGSLLIRPDEAHRTPDCCQRVSAGRMQDAAANGFPELMCYVETPTLRCIWQSSTSMVERIIDISCTISTGKTSAPCHVSKGSFIKRVRHHWIRCKDSWGVQNHAPSHLEKKAWYLTGGALTPSQHLSSEM